MGSNVGTKQQQQQQHNSSVNHSSGDCKGRVENGPHHQSSTFCSIENSCHERKKRPSGSTLSSSTCNQLVTSTGSTIIEPGLLNTRTTSRNTSPSSQSSQSSNSSSSSWNGNNRINVTSPIPSSLNKRSSSNFQDGTVGNRLNQMGIKNTTVSHSNQSDSYERQSKKVGEIRLLSPSNCNSFERNSESWSSSSKQQHEVCGGVGSSSESLSSLLNPITRKQLQDPFYRPFVS